MTALETLLARVEAGEAGWNRLATIAEDVVPPREAALAATAYHGSLDAAKALHEALLPGWEWLIGSRRSACVTPPDALIAKGVKGQVGKAEGNPARALLMADLRALIAAERATQGEQE